jgi:hypothetical protein
MGFSRRRRGTDGRRRYTAYYRDLRGREVSAGTFARKADADAAWQAADDVPVLRGKVGRAVVRQFRCGRGGGSLKIGSQIGRKSD